MLPITPYNVLVLSGSVQIPVADYHESALTNYWQWLAAEMDPAGRIISNDENHMCALGRA
jgi:hypothetical protein